MLVPGHKQKDVYGDKVIEEVTQTVPAGMAEQKIGHSHRAMSDDGVGLHGDIDGAYLTLILGGCLKFLYLIPRLYALFDMKKI